MSSVTAARSLDPLPGLQSGGRVSLMPGRVCLSRSPAALPRASQSILGWVMGSPGVRTRCAPRPALACSACSCRRTRRTRLRSGAGSLDAPRPRRSPHRADRGQSPSRGCARGPSGARPSSGPCTSRPRAVLRPCGGSTNRCDGSRTWTARASGAWSARRTCASLALPIPLAARVTQAGHRWHLVPGAPVEFPAVALFLDAAPLLEKERDAGPQALVANVKDPIRIHGTRTETGLSADYHPVDAVEVEVRERTQQRLQREEADGGGAGREVIDPGPVVVALHTHPEADTWERPR